MRILVVDDDPLAGEMTAAMVEELGHDAVLAENGVEAAEILGNDSSFGLVLSDLNMPMVDGIELFRELRGQGISTPFFLLTGDNPEEVMLKEPGLNGCLMKDFSLADRLPAILSSL